MVVESFGQEVNLLEPSVKPDNCFSLVRPRVFRSIKLHLLGFTVGINVHMTSGDFHIQEDGN